MYLKRNLYRFVMMGALFLGIASGSVKAQNQVQRVSGGVVQRDSSDNVVIDMRGANAPQSPIFRDSIPLSRMSALSIIAPGFSQLYNKQYWKIPVLYGTVGGLTYLWRDAAGKYKDYKRQYDSFQVDSDHPQSQRDLLQARMNNYNTQRTVYFLGAALTYLYFIGDGVINYANQATSVKKATTMAMVFPGAGQMYNKSYWKVPIVIGGFATMGFLIDWNNRGYQRMRKAYNLYPNGEYSTFSRSQIQNSRDQFRRNRDLCIILTGGLYVLSIVEAHVDANLKDFDVSDDLSLRVEPAMIDMSQYRSPKNTGYPGFGMSMKLNF